MNVTDGSIRWICQGKRARMELILPWPGPKSLGVGEASRTFEQVYYMLWSSTMHALLHPSFRAHAVNTLGTPRLLRYLPFVFLIVRNYTYSIVSPGVKNRLFAPPRELFKLCFRNNKPITDRQHGYELKHNVNVNVRVCDRHNVGHVHGHFSSQLIFRHVDNDGNG